MSWIARLRTTEGENEIIAEERFLQKDAITPFYIVAWLFRHNIDDYDMEAIEELNGCYDCMDTARDIQYVLSVFERGKPDPYDNLAGEHERLVDEMRRKGLYYDSLEEFQRRKGDADAQKDNGPSCTCELIF